MLGIAILFVSALCSSVSTFCSIQTHIYKVKRAIDKGISFQYWAVRLVVKLLGWLKRIPDWTFKIISKGETHSSFVEYILNHLIEVSEKNENLILWLFTYICQIQPDDKFQKNCFATSQKITTVFTSHRHDKMQRKCKI